MEYPTIQQALNAAERGDSVHVAAGTYYENVKLRQGVVLQGGWDKRFHVRDSSKHLSIINGGKRGGWVVFGADGAVLDGFVVLSGGSPFVAGGSDIGSGV